MTLQELTNQESGIVVYSGGETVIVCNWSAECPNDNDMPYLFAGNIISQAMDDITLVSTKTYGDYHEAIKDNINDIGVLYDPNDDLNGKDEPWYEGEGTVYKLRVNNPYGRTENVVIIAPHNWN